MPAFRNSARLGVHLLELDVQLTRDMRVVIFHDRYEIPVFILAFIPACSNPEEYLWSS